LLDAMEYIAFKDHARVIEGKFFPHDTTRTKEDLVAFYEKNGYDVDLYEKEIYKNISPARVIAELEPNISQYFITEIDISQNQHPSQDMELI